MSNTDISGYRYTQAGLNHSHGYLLPAVLQLLDGFDLPTAERRLFELGCGNGSVANELARCGWDVTGVDPSVEGIQRARATYPYLRGCWKTCSSKPSNQEMDHGDLDHAPLFLVMTS